MKKINILKENRDYNRIINQEKPFYYKDYVIYLERGTNELYHFGFSVGKKIGNAVVRNKIKRQLKNIINKNSYQNGFNCIIIVRKGILNRNFKEISDNLNDALKQLKIMKGAINEK